MNLLEIIIDYISRVNDHWANNDIYHTILQSVMSPQEQIEFAGELTELVNKNVILQSDKDIMLKDGDEIRTNIENLFFEKEKNKWARKEFLRKLILLLKSYGLSDKYILYVCKRLYPYLT